MELPLKKLSGIFYIPVNATVTFNNIKFINANGSGIYGDSYNYMDDSIVEVIVNNCVFNNNYNNYYGGAIYANTVIALNSNFTGNYVKDPETDGIGMSEGGAIEAYNIELSNCNFIKNNAQLYGGAIYAEKSLIVNSSVFKQNLARTGGAIYCRNYNYYEDDYYAEKSSSVILNNSIFISNYLKVPRSGYTNNFYGGAVYSISVVADNCTFKNNSANITLGSGGAISGTEINVSACVFEKNIANIAGAIYATDYPIDENSEIKGNVKVNNSSFISNNEGVIKAAKISVIYDEIGFVNTFKNKVLDNNLEEMSLYKISSSNISTVYYSGKTLNIKVLTSPSSKPVMNLLLLAVIKSSKKTYSIPISTNSKGIAILKVSNFNTGSYKVYIYEMDCNYGADPGDERYYKISGVLKTSSLKITKAKTIVKAPAVKYKYKKSKYFKITLKHKTTKKVLSAIKLKIKVYTGKKYKTYTVKTNKKGVAKFNTKKLKRGKHKVIISSLNANIVVSKKSSIRIR